MLFRHAALILCIATVTLAADPKLDGQVKQLVEQLKDPKKGKAAEDQLVKLGPDILPLLPAPATLTPPQKKSIAAVRAALNQELVVRDLAPRRATIKGDMPLSMALDSLFKQTDQRLVDRRLAKNDPVVKVDVDKATFWEAADVLAKLADGRISLYEPDQQLALRPGPYRELPTSRQGMFRTQVKEVTTKRDFDTGAHQCELSLELAWEPRFQPLFMYRPSKIVVKDDKGAALQVFPLGSGRDQVTSRLATRIPLRLQAPPRGCLKLSEVKGEVALVGPARMLDFVFTDLDKINPKSTAPTDTKDGIRVSLRSLVVEKNRWSVSFELEYPAEGPEFESFESWLVNAQALLQDRAERRFSTEQFEIPDQTGHRALATFHFLNGKNGLNLTKPADFKVILRTPGRIATVPVPFEFKDVELP